MRSRRVKAKTWGIYGPTKRGRRWGVRLCPPGAGRGPGAERYESFATRAEADAYVAKIREEIRRDDAHQRAAELYAEGDAAIAEAETLGLGRRTVADAIAEYEVARRSAGRVSIETIVRAGHHLRALLTPLERLSVAQVTTARATARYQERTQELAARTRRPISAATHHGELRAARTLWRWLIRQQWVIVNPWADVELIGEVRRGKAQLRPGELRKVRDLALEAASRPTLDSHNYRGEGALATLIVLYCGLRATEVIRLEARDVDRVLTYRPVKQRGAQRESRSTMPDDLRRVLLAHAERCRQAGRSRLFDRKRHWVCDAIQYWCRAAGVPVVTAHGLRGTQATVARGAGATAEDVARQLNHDSTAVTRRHYLADNGLDFDAGAVAAELEREPTIEELARQIAQQERLAAQLRARLEERMGLSEKDGTIAESPSVSGGATETRE